MIPTFAGFNVGVSSPPPPVINYLSTGKFNIDKYNSKLIYTPTLVTGSGNANLNNETGVFTFTSTDARFSVTSRYALSAPESDSRFMEIKSYTYFDQTYTFPTTCTGTRSVPYDCSYETQENYYCCGDPCVVRYSMGIPIAYDCPPQNGWFCQTNYLCCTYQCVRTVTVPKTCYRDEDYTYDCTGTGTRRVKNETPPNFTDSGTEWYRRS